MSLPAASHFFAALPHAIGEGLLLGNEQFQLVFLRVELPTFGGHLGLQRLALPVPSAALANAPALDLRLHLTGSPSRETDYLLAYASSGRGGFLVSLVNISDVGPDATTCTLR